MLTAHGVLAALAFVIFFPLGGIMIRVFHFPGLVWAHGIMQVLGFLVYTAAVALGIYIATTPKESVSPLFPSRVWGFDSQSP